MWYRDINLSLCAAKGQVQESSISICCIYTHTTRINTTFEVGRGRIYKMMLLNSVCVLLSSYLAIVEAAAVPATPPASYSSSSSSSCTKPSKRPEWRALSQAQKTTYIKAVQCLTTKPSRLGLKTSLYEDFAYVHAHLNTESKSPHTHM